MTEGRPEECHRNRDNRDLWCRIDENRLKESRGFSSRRTKGRCCYARRAIAKKSGRRMQDDPKKKVNLVWHWGWQEPKCCLIQQNTVCAHYHPAGPFWNCFRPAKRPDVAVGQNEISIVSGHFEKIGQGRSVACHDCHRKLSAAGVGHPSKWHPARWDILLNKNDRSAGCMPVQEGNRPECVCPTCTFPDYSKR